MFFRFLRSRATSNPKLAEFEFLESGPLRDGCMELVRPGLQWLNDLLRSINHAETIRLAPDLAVTSERQVRDFLSLCPEGRQRADAASGICPTYHFWMRDHDNPALPMAGAIALRVGGVEDADFYYGHLGYHVFPPHRGRHFAERSVRLMLPLALRHGMDAVWITCNPENTPSRRTCQRLGAELVETVMVPADHPLARRGEHFKCRYRLSTGVC